MDYYPNHFPVLLTTCLLVSILFYIASNIVYFFHRRKNLLAARSALTIGAVVSSENFDEGEQEMANYLKDQECK